MGSQKIAHGALRKGKRHPFRPHSVECRLRVYLSWKEHDNLRYKRIRHLLAPDAKKEEKRGNVDLDELQHDRPNPPTPIGNPVPLTPREDFVPPPIVTEDESARWDPATRRSDSESRGPLSVPHRAS